MGGYSRQRMNNNFILFKGQQHHANVHYERAFKDWMIETTSNFLLGAQPLMLV
jgi:hypothetical protein